MRRPVPILASFVLIAAAPAFGVSIPIANHSFETPDVASGTFTNGAPPNWITIGGSSAGVLEGLGGMSPTPDPLDADQNAWSNGPIYTQTLTTNLAADAIYTLTVDIGDRSDAPTPTSITLDLGYGATAGVNLLTPISSVTPAPADGGWATWVLRFSTGASPPGLGQPLRIDMTTNGFQAEYDNVRLNVTPPLAVQWQLVAKAGNAAHSSGYGAVAYNYQISKYEITNTQYTEFLNAVAATDTNSVYNTSMGNPSSPDFGGITRTGSSGSFSYAVIAGREDRPVNHVNWYDALRFVNWLENGKPTGPQNASTTEDGTYTFSGPTTVGPRNPGFSIVLPNNDEWFKAAYYCPYGASYFDYPARSNTPTTCTGAIPTSLPNHANCFVGGGGAGVTPVGSYSASESPWGTFDQGGNVYEWTETDYGGGNRGLRGGSFTSGAPLLAASSDNLLGDVFHFAHTGFRVANVGPVGAPDADSDGIPDVFDACVLDSRNAVAPATCDSDCDGYGNVCDADYDQNFTTNSADFGSYFVPAFKGSFGGGTAVDMDCNGVVSSADFGQYFVPKFKGGSALPGPSGLPCAGTPGCGCCQ